MEENRIEENDQVTGENIDNNDAKYIQLSEKVQLLKNEISKLVVGQDELVELYVVALFSNGHLLLEGYPGIAKTMSAKMLSKTIDAEFSRIQFTPDLMPSDVIGTSIFNMGKSEFEFKKGPLFSQIILIDEINRAPAKTQAALFEVMEERQITVDGHSYKMEFPFMVLATQNPIEQEGTYKLPEAQLDRFLFKVNMTYPGLEDEISILNKFKNDFNKEAKTKVETIFNKSEINEFQKLVEDVHIKDQLINYIATIVFNTRNHHDLYLGASPRASLAILKSAKATAALKGRSFVIPEDIMYVAPFVLNHRVVLTPEKELEGTDSKEVIRGIVEEIEVPR
ncbi:AAA family ATPase [Marinigracilibium pacificum]|uniref:MoxR family ATPase n=1 Tax=Marinigracilibium pacificum TaxID=2729599 RepID=A0A848J0V2_9BACT|nr:MoxR family ATPase [Marinigracilibium pacificum]NMM48180.1 MoxR family ATPase [Marinigracilibium pacificum]